MPGPVKVICLNHMLVPKNFLERKDAPVKNTVLTIISHLGPTHLQRVSPSLGESLWRTGAPFLHILSK